MRRSLLEGVADFLRITRDEVEALAVRAPLSYRSYLIDKKRGGKRLIFHPSKETKGLQYALMTTYLSELPVHEAASAYRRGLRSPLRTNALKHGKYPFTVRLDLVDFFPSITPDVFLTRVEQSAPAKLQASTDDKNFLRNVLFVKVGSKGLGLAIGAPSSPMVSNFVMWSVDKRLTSVAEDITGVYTRYADDVCFSTAVEGGCREFSDRVEAILQEELSANFSLNKKKEIFMSRGTRRVVAGMIVCPDGTVSIGRKRKRYVKSLLNKFRYGVLENQERGKLRGLLAYILDVEPDFYNRLALKYGASLVRHALKE